MDASLRTLERMADGLGARVKTIREVQVDLGTGSTTTVSPANGTISTADPHASSIATAETRLESWKVNAILSKEAKDRERLKANPIRTSSEAESPETAKTVYDGRELTVDGRPKALTRKLRRSIRREYGYWPPRKLQPDPIPDNGALCKEASTPAINFKGKNGTKDTHCVGIESIDDTSVSKGTGGISSFPSETVDGSASEMVFPEEYNLEKEEHLRIRRHLRKQWKKERQLSKRGEGPWDGSPSTSSWQSTSGELAAPHVPLPHKGKHTHSPLPAWTPPSSAPSRNTPEDRFMDALVSIFDGVTLDPLTAEEEAMYRTFGISGLSPGAKAKKKKKKWRHRYNHMKKVAEMAVTPENGHEVGEDAYGTVEDGQTDISWYEAPHAGATHDPELAPMSDRAALTIPFSVPRPPAVTSGAPSKNGSGHHPHTVHRFATECLVYFPEEDDEGGSSGAVGTAERGEADELGPIEEDEQDDEDEEDPLFGGFVSKKPKKPRDRLKGPDASNPGRRPSAASGKNSFMRQHYIDFENPALIFP